MTRKRQSILSNELKTQKCSKTFTLLDTFLIEKHLQQFTKNLRQFYRTDITNPHHFFLNKLDHFRVQILFKPL